MKAQSMAPAAVLKAILICTLFSLAACTKAKEIKSTVSPEAYVTKADYEGKVFSLVRGIEEADSNNVIGAIPGFSQDFGLVYVRITETEVQFIEVYNLKNKPGTQSILASFAIKDHFDIQREQNDFGETTHKIIENKERPWSERKYMRVDWSKPTNASSELATTTSVPNVMTENVVLLSSPVNENGHISWLTEFSAKGASGWWGVDPSSRVIARTHLMPFKQTDFEPLNYRSEDFKRFGYFFTRQEVENPERGLLDSELENLTMAQMHNVCEPGRKNQQGVPLSCSTGKVVWHLSKNYPEKFKAVTRQAVGEWNQVFKSALGRSDDVVVLDESKEVDIVDPRYNVLAHYGAKSPGGLLGVAQWASNPITGELLAVRATVYEDGIRGTLGWVDDIVNLILQDDEIRKAFLATDEETKERVNLLFRNMNAKVSETSIAGPSHFSLKSKLGLSTSKRLSMASRKTSREITAQVRASLRSSLDRLIESPLKSRARKEKLMKQAPDLFASVEIARMGGSLSSFDEAFGMLGATSPTAGGWPRLGGVEHLHDLGTGLKEEKARLLDQAESGIHGSELVEEAALRYIKKILAAHPEAADFKAQVAAIKRDVEIKTFYTTLLHEMGHTFGLRHNFHASADEKHYHPEYHRLLKKMSDEASLPAEQKTVQTEDLDPYMFSSIMDYGGDFYSQVGGLAPYDQAAIRYAYNKSIDRTKDPVVKAGYKFCTDHEVNETILCRRFDKGRNVSEITFNLIEDYQTNWVLSHFRRDRANFEQRARSFPINALVRYFVPIRQVMDEFLYSLVDSKTVAAGENECDIESWRTSVDNQEIVNVCNFPEAERAGVDPTNLETFEAALFDENGLKKDPSSYKPYGLADILFANLLAKQFFRDVIGATEPGRYIAEPIGKGEFNLQKLPADGNVDEALKKFATDRGIPTTEDVMVQLRSLVGEVKVGRYGKPLNSEWDESGSFPKQKNIGAFWDKYIALVALGLKDIGVEKYARRSMSGNAHAYPHTNEYSRSLIQSVITQTDRLVKIPFRTAAGVLPAAVEPALNLDMKAIASITALTDFISDSDKSMADQMRICSQDDAGCRPIKDQKVIEFTTASGQGTYRATQTRDQKSIAYKLVESAAKIDGELKTWLERAARASDSSAKNILKVTELAEKREPLEKSLRELNIKEMSDILGPLLSADPATPSMWQIVNLIATRSEEIPLFNLISLAEQSGGILNATAQILEKSLTAADPKGECSAKAEPAAAPLSPGESKLPAGGGSNGVNRLAKVSRLTQRLQAESATAQEKPPGNGLEKCVEIRKQTAPILAAAQQFEAFATVIGDILNSSIEAKASPLRVRQLTDQLESSEASIRLIREVSKATGSD